MIDLQILGVGASTEAVQAALAQAPLPDGWIYTVVDYLQPDGKVLVMAREARSKLIRAARASTLDDAITRLIERLSFEEQYERLKEEIVVLRSELLAAKKEAEDQRLMRDESGRRLKEEVEGLRVIETKWTELLPKLDVLRQYLFRVDRKLSGLDEAGMIEEPGQVVDYTSAFLSVLEFYFPSTQEEELAASELTRLEALGQELNRTGSELKEEVRREFASLKAQVETEIGRLETENVRLKAESARLRPYADPRLLERAATVIRLDNEGAGEEDMGPALDDLAEAVAWWDALVGAGVELEQYEEGVGDAKDS